MIIVSRDPLDQCASLMEGNKGIGMEMKLRPDSEKYIKWLMRQKRNIISNQGIMYCKYEEIISDYDSQVKKIFGFCEIDMSEHILKRKYFDPEVSKTRIGKWKKYLNDSKYGELFANLEIAVKSGRLW